MTPIIGVAFRVKELKWLPLCGECFNVVSVRFSELHELQFTVEKQLSVKQTCQVDDESYLHYTRMSF